MAGPSEPIEVFPLLISGQRVQSQDYSDVINPFDGSIVARVALADAAMLDSAVEGAYAAFEQTRRQPPFERAELLSRIAAGLRTRKADFAATIVAEAGKPITLAEAEVDRAVITFTAAAEEARRNGGQLLDADAFSTGAGHIAMVRRFPVGVVYGMTPFNFPLNLVAHKLAPALACGAAIILKPSPRTPISTIKLAELAIECGALPGQVSVINCPNSLATLLIDDPRVKVISFTGSATVGKTIARQAAGKKLTLELGGNAAVAVREDADLEAAVSAIAAGAFGYAGQSCISVQRILIKRDVYDSVRDLLVGRTKTQILTGDPNRRDVINGPMIDAGAQQRVLSLIKSAVSEGATILTGGGKVGPCLKPTLLENVPLTHDLWAEEAFAPIAVLRPYVGAAEAIQLINGTRYGLQAGLFTRDIRAALRAFESLEVGGVLINETPTFRLDHLPYGGVKDSGLGREGVRWAMDEMTEPRSLVIRG